MALAGRRESDFFVTFGSNARDFSTQLDGELAGARKTIDALRKEIQSLYSESRSANPSLGQGLIAELQGANEAVSGLKANIGSIAGELNRVLGELRNLGTINVKVRYTPEGGGGAHVPIATQVSQAIVEDVAVASNTKQRTTRAAQRTRQATETAVRATEEAAVVAETAASTTRKQTERQKNAAGKKQRAQEAETRAVEQASQKAQQASEAVSASANAEAQALERIAAQGRAASQSLQNAAKKAKVPLETILQGGLSPSELNAVARELGFEGVKRGVKDYTDRLARLNQRVRTRIQDMQRVMEEGGYAVDRLQELPPTPTTRTASRTGGRKAEAEAIVRGLTEAELKAQFEKLGGGSGLAQALGLSGRGNADQLARRIAKVYGNMERQVGEAIVERAEAVAQAVARTSGTRLQSPGGVINYRPEEEIRRILGENPEALNSTLQKIGYRGTLSATSTKTGVNAAVAALLKAQEALPEAGPLNAAQAEAHTAVVNETKATTDAAKATKRKADAKEKKAAADNAQATVLEQQAAEVAAETRDLRAAGADPATARAELQRRVAAARETALRRNRRKASLTEDQRRQQAGWEGRLLGAYALPGEGLTAGQSLAAEREAILREALPGAATDAERQALRQQITGISSVSSLRSLVSSGRSRGGNALNQVLLGRGGDKLTGVGNILAEYAEVTKVAQESARTNAPKSQAAAMRATLGRSIESVEEFGASLRAIVESETAEVRAARSLLKKAGVRVELGARGNEPMHRAAMVGEQEVGALLDRREARYSQSPGGPLVADLPSFAMVPRAAESLQRAGLERTSAVRAVAEARGQMLAAQRAVESAPGPSDDPLGESRAAIERFEATKLAFEKAKARLAETETIVEQRTVALVRAQEMLASEFAAGGGAQGRIPFGAVGSSTLLVGKTMVQTSGGDASSLFGKSGSIIPTPENVRTAGGRGPSAGLTLEEYNRIYGEPLVGPLRQGEARPRSGGIIPQVLAAEEASRVAADREALRVLGATPNLDIYGKAPFKKPVSPGKDATDEEIRAYKDEKANYSAAMEGWRRLVAAVKRLDTSLAEEAAVLETLSGEMRAGRLRQLQGILGPNAEDVVRYGATRAGYTAQRNAEVEAAGGQIVRRGDREQVLTRTAADARAMGQATLDYLFGTHAGLIGTGIDPSKTQLGGRNDPLTSVLPGGTAKGYSRASFRRAIEELGHSPQSAGVKDLEQLLFGTGRGRSFRPGLIGDRGFGAQVGGPGRAFKEYADQLKAGGFYPEDPASLPPFEATELEARRKAADAAIKRWEERRLAVLQKVEEIFGERAEYIPGDLAKDRLAEGRESAQRRAEERHAALVESGVAYGSLDEAIAANPALAERHARMQALLTGVAEVESGRGSLSENQRIGDALRLPITGPTSEQRSAATAAMWKIIEKEELQQGRIKNNQIIKTPEQILEEYNALDRRSQTPTYTLGQQELAAARAHADQQLRDVATQAVRATGVHPVTGEQVEYGRLPVQAFAGQTFDQMRETYDRLVREGGPVPEALVQAREAEDARRQARQHVDTVVEGAERLQEVAGKTPAEVREAGVQGIGNECCERIVAALNQVREAIVQLGAKGLTVRTSGQTATRSRRAVAGADFFDLGSEAATQERLNEIKGKNDAASTAERVRLQAQLDAANRLVNAPRPVAPRSPQSEEQRALTRARRLAAQVEAGTGSETNAAAARTQVLRGLPEAVQAIMARAVGAANPIQHYAEAALELRKQGYRSDTAEARVAGAAGIGGPATPERQRLRAAIDGLVIASQKETRASNRAAEQKQRETSVVRQLTEQERLLALVSNYLSQETRDAVAQLRRVEAERAALLNAGGVPTAEHDARLRAARVAAYGGLSGDLGGARDQYGRVVLPAPERARTINALVGVHGTERQSVANEAAAFGASAAFGRVAEQEARGWNGRIMTALFGTQGLGGRAISASAHAVTRYFGYGLVFGITNELHKVFRASLETEAEFVRISDALNATGRSAEGLRSSLQGISSDLATPLEEVYVTASQLTGIFTTTQDVEFATRAVEQLKLISRNALNAQEGISSLQAITSAYGLTGGQAFQSIVDKATALQNFTGANVEQILEGAGGLAPQAQQFGLSENQLLAFPGLIAQRTNQTGAAASEQLSRIFEQLSSERGQGTLRQLGVANSRQLREGRYGEIFEEIIRQRASGELTDQELLALENVVGPRQARPLAAFIGSQDQAKATLRGLAAEDNAAGAGQERVRELMNQLNRELQQLSVNFVNLGAALVRSGILDGLEKGVSLANTLLRVFGRIGDVFDTLSKIPGFNFLKTALVDAGSLYLLFKLIGTATQAIRSRLGAGLAAAGVGPAGARRGTASYTDTLARDVSLRAMLQGEEAAALSRGNRPYRSSVYGPLLPDQVRSAGSLYADAWALRPPGQRVTALDNVRYGRSLGYTGVGLAAGGATVAGRIVGAPLQGIGNRLQQLGVEGTRFNSVMSRTGGLFSRTGASARNAGQSLLLFQAALADTAERSRLAGVAMRVGSGALTAALVALPIIASIRQGTSDRRQKIRDFGEDVFGTAPAGEHDRDRQDALTAGQRLVNEVGGSEGGWLNALGSVLSPWDSGSRRTVGIGLSGFVGASDGNLAALGDRANKIRDYAIRQLDSLKDGTATVDEVNESFRQTYETIQHNDDLSDSQKANATQLLAQYKFAITDAFASFQATLKGIDEANQLTADQIGAISPLLQAGLALTPGQRKLGLGNALFQQYSDAGLVKPGSRTGRLLGRLLGRTTPQERFGLIERSPGVYTPPGPGEEAPTFPLNPNTATGSRQIMRRLANDLESNVLPTLSAQINAEGPTAESYENDLQRYNELMQLDVTLRQQIAQTAVQEAELLSQILLGLGDTSGARKALTQAIQADKASLDNYAEGSAEQRQVLLDIAQKQRQRADLAIQGKVDNLNLSAAQIDPNDEGAAQRIAELNRQAAQLQLDELLRLQKKGKGGVTDHDIALARIAVAQTQVAVSSAGGSTEDKAEAIAEAYAALQETLTRDPFQKIQVHIDELKRQIAHYRAEGDTAKVYELQAQLVEAERQAADLVAASIHAHFDLLIAVATAGGHTLRAARLALRQAQKDYEQALKANGGNERAPEVQQAAAAKVAAEANIRDVHLQNREETLAFQYEMGKITVSTYIDELKELLKWRDLTRAQRREIRRTIHDLQNQNEGLWNFGDIKMPTPYEARRLMQRPGSYLGRDQRRQFQADYGGSSLRATSAATAASNYVTNQTTTNHVSIRGADLHEVKRYLLSILGPQAIDRTTTYNRK